MTITWPQLKYHAMQRELWFSTCRFAYVPCGRQSGKTELALRRLVRYLAIKKPWADPRYFYGGPTYQQAKRTAWNRLLELIPKEWISDVSLSELSIRTIFGSEVFIIGLDKPQRIEGLMIDGGIIDECSDIRPKTFDLSVLPTLGHRDAWVWQIGVPKRFGVGASEFQKHYEQAVSGELDDSQGFSWMSKDIVPDNYLEHCRSVMDEYDYEEQFEAKWITSGGGIFHAFSKEYNVRPCIYDPSKVILVGSDFNVNPMSWIFCHLKGDVLEVFDELWIRNTNTPAALDVMLKRYAGHKGGWQMYGDASSQSRHTSAFLSDYTHIADNITLRAMGRKMNYMRSNPPVADRFAVTNSRICNGTGTRQLFIDSKCQHLIDDLMSRTFKPGTRLPDDSGDVGHATDALGYVLFSLFPLRLMIQSTKQKVMITTGV